MENKNPSKYMKNKGKQKSIKIQGPIGENQKSMKTHRKMRNIKKQK